MIWSMFHGGKTASQQPSLLPWLVYFKSFHKGVIDLIFIKAFDHISSSHSALWSKAKGSCQMNADTEFAVLLPVYSAKHIHAHHARCSNQRCPIIPMSSSLPLQGIGQGLHGCSSQGSNIAAGKKSCKHSAPTQSPSLRRSSQDSVMQSQGPRRSRHWTSIWVGHPQLQPQSRRLKFHPISSALQVSLKHHSQDNVGLIVTSPAEVP